jgi:hypothetical protein
VRNQRVPAETFNVKVIPVKFSNATEAEERRDCRLTHIMILAGEAIADPLACRRRSGILGFSGYEGVIVE